MYILHDRSYATSFRYVGQDLLGIAVCICLRQYVELIPFVTIRIVCSVVLFIIQGAFMTGLWILGHECGHGAFSPNLIVNNTVGCIIHSMFLIPYWSWKYTHGQHHSNANSMESDTVFVPNTYKDIAKKNNNDRGSAISRFFCIIRMSLIGFFVYLLFDVNGLHSHSHKKHKKYNNSSSYGWQSHFNPFCPLFNKSQRKCVIGSDIALLISIYILYQVTQATDMWFMTKVYWVSVMCLCVFNCVYV